jgi:gliding motility-associated-like protein
MKKILLPAFILLTNITNAQNGFNFSCTRDTLIPCTVPCITLQARIPDLFGNTSSYSLNPVSGSPNGCYTAPVPPDLPGTPTNLTTDDVYSSVIPLGFSFPFYGVNYSSLVASTNGYVSFDISLTGAFSHYTVTNDLPSASYDRAVIMGPYHDLDPSTRSSPPPEMRIKYETLGTTPYRRWVFSFYHVPLFSSTAATCGVLNQNTQQIVLYESTGIIEIFVANKQICNVWQSGKAILGIQNFARNQGLMAPNRAASSPPWGTIGMNESWRFVPNAGTSLFKRVELYDLANNLISTGTTTPGGNNTFNVDFPNVCPTLSTTTYIVKSVYEKIDDATVEIFGTDTVTVTRDASLPVSASIVEPTCNTGNGTITVTDPVGPIYDYSVDGINWQTSPVFNLPANTYTVRARINGSFCGGNTTVTLTAPPPIPITATVTAAACKNTSTGTIMVTSPVGTDIEYSINGGTTWQTSNSFNNLSAGSYTITINQISISCRSSQMFNVTEPTLLTASAVPASQASCANNDGSIDITPAGGTPTYEYSANGGTTWQPSNILTGLPVGTYSNIRVRDMNGCIANVAAQTVTLNDTMRLELGADSTICFGSSITLIPQTNTLTDNFKWSPKLTLNYDTVRTPIATPNDTTKYYLTAKWGLCTRKDSVIVNILHKPVAYAGADTTICYKTNATLYGSARNLSGSVNFAWSPPDSLSNPNAAVTGVRMDTTRQFTLTVTDNYGCNFSVTDSVTIFMNPKLAVFAGNDTNAIIYRPHQLMASGGVNYVWSPTGPLNNPFISNPLAVLSNDTYFTVQVTDAIGCTASDDVFIKVYEGPTYYLPTAFTPNGDGLNDIFFPTPVGMKSTDYFRVFDRYGKTMYETRQWMQGWDGTLKGKPATAGAYVWAIKGIDKNGAVVEMKGTVVLIR